jgi:hypothetical protein
MLSTAVTRLLEIDVPLIQAPMGGGPSTPEMAGTVSDAGALGSLAGGYLSGSQISQQIAAVRAVTNKPFAVNLFAPHDSAPTPEEIDEAQRLLEPYRRELGLPARGEAGPAAHDFDEQLQAVIDEKPNVVSFTFGLLPPAAVASLKDAGCVLIGTATTVAEAVAVAESGADMVCAQGSEAGPTGVRSSATEPTRWLAPSRWSRRCATSSASQWSRRAGSWTAAAWSLSWLWVPVRHSSGPRSCAAQRLEPRQRIGRLYPRRRIRPRR